LKKGEHTAVINSTLESALAESSSAPSLDTPVVPVISTAEKLRNLSFYRQALTPTLAPEVFKPNPYRMIAYFLCVFVSVGAFYFVVTASPAWEIKLLCGLLIGWCYGTLGFLCHELAHGSIVKNQKLQWILSFIGMIPFTVSPTYWKFSHNRLHHGKAQKLIEDPDAFPNLRIYKSSKFIQFMFPFTPGSKHKRSAFYFFFWFSFHNFVAQSYLRFRNKIFSPMDQTRVTLEFGAQILIAVAALIIAGPSNWLWLFIVPMAVQNYLLMSYISTNHNLSPLTGENDPLANSLSVSNHPILEFLHLNFGYHVEHHIYPTINPKHAKAIHRELKKQFPNDYKFMPKLEAMTALYKTPRIYKSAHVLIHPETLDTFPTI
jgi:fatty acid desaturase